MGVVTDCRTSSFCTVAWQLARFQLTRRIAQSLVDSSPNGISSGSSVFAGLTDRCWRRCQLRIVVSSTIIREIFLYSLRVVITIFADINFLLSLTTKNISVVVLGLRLVLEALRNHFSMAILVLQKGLVYITEQGSHKPQRHGKLSARKVVLCVRWPATGITAHSL